MSWGPDERGNYRIWGLAPGEYYVVALGSPVFNEAGRDLHLTSDVDVQQAARAIQDGPSVPPADVRQRTVGTAPIYYPGTAAVAQATPLILRPGEERAGVDFGVQYVPTSRVEGHVTAPDGTPLSGTQVAFFTKDPGAGAAGFVGVRSARTNAAGRFTLAEVIPGSYTLAARASIPTPGSAGDNAQWFCGSADVDVTGEDITELSLPLQDSLTTSGMVRFDGATPPPPWSSLRVSLNPSQTGTTVLITSGSATVGPDGRFTLTGVSPGRYLLQGGLPSSQSPWIQRSSTVGGHEALDLPIEIRQSAADAVITFADRASELTGHVRTAAAAAPDYSVDLFSANREHWFAQSRRVLATRAASDGSFVFKNVPPGEYQIAAVDDVEQGEWYDPTFLQRLVPSALAVAIADGEKQVQDIRAGGG